MGLAEGHSNLLAQHVSHLVWNGIFTHIHRDKIGPRSSGFPHGAEDNFPVPKGIALTTEPGLEIGPSNSDVVDATRRVSRYLGTDSCCDTATSTRNAKS
jgi:hypothetical protein